MPYKPIEPIGVSIDERTGFAWPIKAHYERSPAQYGVLFLEDCDVCDRVKAANRPASPLIARNGFIKVLLKSPTDNSWTCTTTSKFAPGRNKLHLMLKTDEDLWEPFPYVMSRLAEAFDAGHDILSLPMQRCRVQLEFGPMSERKKSAEGPTGVVSGVPEWVGPNTDYSEVYRFLRQVLPRPATAEPRLIPIQTIQG